MREPKTSPLHHSQSYSRIGPDFEDCKYRNLIGPLTTLEYLKKFQKNACEVSRFNVMNGTQYSLSFSRIL